MAIIPPVFVDEHEVSFGTLSSSGGSANTGSFSVTAGDLLVIVGSSEDASRTLNTPTGGSLTYTLHQSVVVTDYTTAYVWTAVCTSTTSITVTITVAGTGDIRAWGFNVLRFQKAGVGASTKTNVSSGAPTVTLTTTRNNSAIVMLNSDWNAQDGASRTYRTNAGTFTEQTYFRDAARYATYNGYHANAGTAAGYAVGLTAPGSQKYSIVALEVVGTNVDIDRASETDTANAITAVATNTVAIGQATETDTAQAITVVAPTVVSIGRADETDTARDISPSAGDIFTIGQAQETDTAQAITVVSTVVVAIDRASETDTANAITPVATNTVPVGLATETDTAQAVTVAATVTVPIGLASETDTANTIVVAASNTISVGLATETDTANTITPVATVTVSIGRADESDTANTITVVAGAVAVPIGLASEVDSADNISPSTVGTISIGTAVETDTAQTITVTSTVTVTIGLATETDTAQSITPLSGAVSVSIGQAQETDTAQVIDPQEGALSVPVGVALETDTAGVITPAMQTTVSIGLAVEADTAQAITATSVVVVGIGLAEETSSARPILPVVDGQLVGIGIAVELDTAGGITPVAGVAGISIGMAVETDLALEILFAEDQEVSIGLATEVDFALPIVVREASGENPFFSGPCADWEPLWCGELSAAAMAVTGDAVTMATEILWQMSGQRFGLCEVTLRPCRSSCAEGYGTLGDWWSGVGTTPRLSGGGPRPWWSNGVWFNVCGLCSGGCSCTWLEEALLPAPTRTVEAVRVDGITLNPSQYRVDENRKLVRTDGTAWPMCQDMAKGDDQPGTWSVTITVGEDVPVLARRAVADLAAEFAKDCAGEECQVPYDITLLSRQGVTLDFGNPNVERIDPIVRMLGLRMVRLFLATYNPHGLQSRGKVYDVDRMPRPWKRVNTS